MKQDISPFDLAKLISVKLERLPQVEAVALGGSQVGEQPIGYRIWTFMFTRTNRFRLLALAHHLCAKLSEAMAEDFNPGISASANPSGNLRAIISTLNN